MDQLRQRCSALPVAVERVLNQLAHVLTAERREANLLHRHARGPDRFKPPHERVRGRDLIVPVGADHNDVPHIRLSDQIVEQIERGCIQPLQIVQEQSQRVLGTSEDAEKAPEHALEPALGVLRWLVRDRGLLANNDL
jgi:hypothetical protein